MLTLHVQIRDDLIVNVFVNHQRLNQKGEVVEKHNHNHDEESKNQYEESDSDEEEEEEIDAEKDDEEDTQITNRFTVDMIAQCQNNPDDLILHWGMSKKNPGEWGPPDDKYFPLETKRFTDGKACQTKFIKDQDKPDFREIKMDIKWIQELEPAVKSISYVLHEPKKNAWHNNWGKDYHIKFMIESEGNHVHRGKGFPFGKLGDVVAEIIECETVYVSLSLRFNSDVQGSWTLMHRYGRCKDILQGRIEQENREHM